MQNHFMARFAFVRFNLGAVEEVQGSSEYLVQPPLPSHRMTILLPSTQSVTIQISFGCSSVQSFGPAFGVPYFLTSALNFGSDLIK